jgi:hypothetical protein
MAKKDPTQEALQALRALPAGEASWNALRQALQHKSSLVVARAAKMVGEWLVASLSPDLMAAFGRIAGKDPGASARTELVRALCALEAREEDFFLQHRRLQVADWNGDAAAELRGLCALGLARGQSGQALARLTEMLLDREPTTRQLVCQALAEGGYAQAVPLLRYLIFGCETDAGVLIEALLSLLSLDLEMGLETCTQLWNEGRYREEVSEALSLIRREEAVLKMLSWYDRELPVEVRRALLVALLTTRHRAAVPLLSSLPTCERDLVGQDLLWDWLADQQPDV